MADVPTTSLKVQGLILNMRGMNADDLHILRASEAQWRPLVFKRDRHRQIQTFPAARVQCNLASQFKKHTTIGSL